VFRKFPASGTAHDYRYKTTVNYWSAVVAWSPNAGDVDLALYDDKAHTQLLENSAWGSGMTDFVAVDSNQRAMGTYFPRIRTASGTGSYYVEFAEGADQLGAGVHQLPMASSDIVAVRDTYLLAGHTYTFTLEPGSLSQDGDMFLMQSNSGVPDTWVQGRSDAVASASGKGAGQTETFQFTPAVTDWYGLVIINELQGGTFTLTRN
jgi:hypothetical protein